jgi:hypothetical protein
MPHWEGVDVQLINTDGMAFIGPGSEWFWTALTAVVVAVTFVAIYRQLSVQAAANATARVESLWAGWSTFDMQYYRLVLALHLKYEGFQGTVVPGNLSWEKVRPVVLYIGDIARLVKGGHLSIDEVSFVSVVFRQWVVALRPFYEMRRAAGLAAPVDDSELEWLATRLEEWDAKHGGPRPLVPTSVWLDDVIDRTTANLRLEQERKAGIIPGPPVTVD